MKMEIADIRLTLGGEFESIKVNKANVTVAEAMVLCKVHGDSSVHNIRNIRTADVSAVAHKRYLSERYMRSAGDESKRDVAGLLFPGLAPNFPGTFAESGLLRPEEDGGDEAMDEAGNAASLDTGVTIGGDDDDGKPNENLPKTQQGGTGRAARGAAALAAAVE